MKTIQLPAPKTLGTLSFEEALKARRTNRECTNAALDDAELAALLGLRRPHDGRRPPDDAFDARPPCGFALRSARRRRLALECRDEHPRADR